MRGFVGGRSCLLQLAMWAALAAAIYFFLRSVGGPGVGPIITSIAAGLLLSMAALLVHGVFQAARERRMLLAADDGSSRREGAWIAVSGEIRSSAPVRGPISGEAVVAYEYSVARDVQMGRSRSIVPYFEGKALSSSAIYTSQGAVRLLAVPVMDVAPAPVERSRAIANVKSFINQTTFEPRETAKQRTDALSREWTDDDGVFRIDKRIFGGEVNLEEDFHFEERQIRQGERVCAFGQYSAERRGIVPDLKWGQHCRIAVGSAEEMANALRARMARYSFGALLLAGAAIAVGRLYLSG